MKINPQRKNNKLEEGIHFYMESGFMVFTALYLKERGYCCGSGCRHCPYLKDEEETLENPKQDSL